MKAMRNTIKYSISLRSNMAHPDEPLKAYANLQLNKILDLDGLAAHIREHGSLFSKGTIKGILEDMCDCMKEALEQGFGIELGPLGRFEPSITCNGASATETEYNADGTIKRPARTAAENFTADNITGLNVNFQSGNGLNFDRNNMEFEYVTTRKVQNLTKKAQKEGKTTADWTDATDDGTSTPSTPSTPSPSTPSPSDSNDNEEGGEG
ncbi:MAG: hypothetical protein IJ700_08030 [Bacteroidaceae bacterium]|nr:hypothetical protein [Bacteroidaceae bacterium]